MAASKMVGRNQNGPQLRKQRKDGWTPARRRRFFEVLGATCNVSAAARAAGMHKSGADRLRRRDADFRAQWTEAVREGYARLELMMLERMMKGTVKTITYADGSVVKIHEYPNAVAVTLLRLHKAEAAAADIVHDFDEIEEARERIARKLAKVRERLEAADQEGAAPDAPLLPPPANDNGDEGDGRACGNEDRHDDGDSR